MNIKQMGRIAEFHLEEAVLGVLMQAFAADPEHGIGAAEISHRTGIYRDRGVIDAMNDAIVTGMLVKLHEQGRVERCEQTGGRGGWKITDAEYARRADHAD